MSTSHQSRPLANRPSAVASLLVIQALLVSLIALGGSLWLSIGMNLKACPLCFYQRTFVMGAAAVLCMGLLLDREHWPVLHVLALPLAVAGLAVAAFHVYLESTGKLECPKGILDIGTAPQQSLVALTVLVADLTLGALVAAASGAHRVLSVLLAVIVGLALAAAAVKSAPPPPPAPQAPYDTPLDTCRPPFRGAN